MRARTNWESTQQCLIMLEVSGTKSFETLYLRPGLLHPDTQLFCSALQQIHVAMHADRAALQKVPKCRHTAAHQTKNAAQCSSLFPFCTSEQPTCHHADAFTYTRFTLSTAHLYRRTSGHCVDIFSAVNILCTPVIIKVTLLTTPLSSFPFSYSLGR